MIDKYLSTYVLAINEMLHLFQYVAMMAAAAAIRKSADKTESNSNNGCSGDSVANFLYSRVAAAQHHHQHLHYHGAENFSFSSAINLATFAALQQERLLATKNSSIADLRLKAKKHSEALLLERTADKLEIM